MQQTDGKLVVAGWVADALRSHEFRTDGLLVRYLPDGGPDPSFGTGGIVRVAPLPGGVATGFDRLLLQPDGRLIAVGNATEGGYLPQASWMGGDLFLARYEPGGSLDPTFGTGGVQAIDVRGADVLEDAVLQEDGGIVVAVSPFGLGAVSAIVRLLSDGTLDPTFGVGGVADLSVAGEFRALDLVIEPGGRIILAGTARAAGGSGREGALLALHANGAVDTGFGVGGLARVGALLGAVPDYLSRVGRLATGHLVASGFLPYRPEMGRPWFLVRFGPTGTVDPTFGNGGAAGRGLTV